MTPSRLTAFETTSLFVDQLLLSTGDVMLGSEFVAISPGEVRGMN